MRNRRLRLDSLADACRWHRPMPADGTALRTFLKAEDVMTLKRRQFLPKPDSAPRVQIVRQTRRVETAQRPMEEMPMLTRRRLMTAGAGMALAGIGFDPRLALAAIADLPAALPEGVRKNATLEALPGKKPLIKLSYRPPNYETPLQYFRTAITPHDAFFVRYHLSHMPDVDVKTWKIVVGGEGANGRAEF